ncbi:MAG: peptide deformylase [Thermodesulfobacteriota bacterium]
MPILPIRAYPDPILRQPAEAIGSFDSQLRDLVANMIATMHAAPGIGLAANQVGLGCRLAVVDLSSSTETRSPLILVNPVIVSGSGSEVDDEGCLSIKGYTAGVKRMTSILVRAQDPEGKTREFEATDLLARVIQHELDHLDGRLFIDRLSALKRSLFKKRLAKMLREQEP